MMEPEEASTAAVKAEIRRLKQPPAPKGNAKWIRPDEMNTSRFVRMAPRKERRLKQGKNFRPVYGHAIPVNPDHKAIMAAMSPIDREQKRQWLVGCALIAWGEAIRDSQG